MSRWWRRHAVLVNPKTGALITLIWAIAKDDKGVYYGMYGDCEWLPPNHLEDRLMHVDANEFSFGLITENALAMVALFKGKARLTFSPELKAIAEQARYTPEAAADLEQKLWAVIRSTPTQ